jgi:glucose-1-phosphate cytidylyltransferase
MKVVVLCGGTGTRLKEMTEFIPKPLIPIGGKPLIWHILKLYAHYGFTDFILALGYKQEAFKEYFMHFDQINNDIKVQTGNIHMGSAVMGGDDYWEVVLADTGLNTFKGGRLKRVEKYIDGDTFFMTYGDTIGDVDIKKLLKFHLSHGKLATVTGVHPTPRFGEIHREKDAVLSFSEKPLSDNHLINGGFFVFNRKVLNYLTTDEWCDLEIGPLELIAAKGEMMVYHHKGMWGCMDTLPEMHKLNHLWETGEAKWRVWKDV